MAIFFGNPWQDETYEVSIMTIGEDIEMTFAIRIQEELNNRGMSASQLCLKAGITRSTFSALKSRGSNPKPLTRKAICQALDLNPETLEPIELPKRSAWDDLWANDMLLHTNEDVSEYIIDAKCLNKYKNELKQIPAKD